MDTELQIMNQEKHADAPQVKLENNKSSFENVDYTHCFETIDSHVKIEIDDNKKHVWNEHYHLQNISDQHHNNGSGLGKRNQPHQEEKFENDKSCFENVDYAHCFEIIDSNVQDIDNLNQNMDKSLWNTKQELEVKKERLETNENTDSDSNIHDNGNVYDTKVVQIIHIKQEIKEHQEISNLEEISYPTNEIKDTKLIIEKSELIVKTEIQSTDFEAGSSNVENTFIPSSNLARTNFDIENSSSIIGMDLKIENTASNIDNTASNIDNSDLKFENTDSRNEAMVLIKNKADPLNPGSDNRLEIENSSSIIGMDLKIENTASNIDNSDLKFENTNSRNLAMALIQNRADSLNPGNDNRLEIENLQPIVLIKRLQDSDFNHGSPVCKSTKNDFQVDAQEHTSSYQSQTGNSELLLKWFCNDCEKGFKTKYDLKSHMISHSTERPYKCNKCKKGFKQMTHLRKHMVKHSTERPYQCNICGNRFKTMSNLRKHMISHSTEQPHKCKQCDKGFKTMCHLREHMISHGTERPYQCNTCDNGFKRKSHLREHMIRHRTDQSHNCKLCDKMFKTVSGLRKHDRSQHQDTTLV